MKNAILLAWLVLINCSCILLASNLSEQSDVTLQGIGEDIWGNKIDLASYNKRMVLIHPFSPANCGYCFVDDEFVQENYFTNNKKTGGFNFSLCLFNPQLDIYTYVKHFRDTSTILTFPPNLHDYHGNGFPMIIAFRNGKLICRESLDPYEEMFKALSSQFWPEEKFHLKLVSSIMMGEFFIQQNEHSLAVYVISDGDKASYEKASQLAERKQLKSFIVKYESDLNDIDLQKNMFFKGTTENFKFRMFANKNVPITITSSDIKFQSYTFSKQNTGLNACYPNPLNNKTYIVLQLHGTNIKSEIFENWVDYTIYEDGPNGKPQVLLNGFFDKKDNTWKFSPSMAYGIQSSSIFCEKGFCIVPLQRSRKYQNHEYKIYTSPWGISHNGAVKTLGKSACRFPSITTDENDICWVTWEESGNISLASINHSISQIAVNIENNCSDSFNPIIAFDGSELWVFYLNNHDGFYRLYAKSFDGVRLSDEMLISENGPFDAVTPAVASNKKNKLVIGWSEWKANEKHLRYRFIENRSLGKVQTATIKKPSIDYRNAWYASFTFDCNGTVYGAWNQHYPATLGVCSGNLTQEATSVTKLNGEVAYGGNLNVHQTGGYPSIVIDNNGSKWVFWESSGWDIRDDIPQKILGSYYDEKNGQWSLPYTISLAEQTILNQTPKAVIDEHGVIWVVWSGRENDISKSWGIYMSYFSNKKWSVPKLISEEGINSRAPNCIANDNKIWITWHSGTGENMQIKVLEYSPAISSK